MIKRIPKHGEFIREFLMPNTFNSNIWLNDDDTEITKEELNGLIASKRARFVGKESNYNIYLSIDATKVVYDTKLDKQLINHMAKIGWYYIPDEDDDDGGLDFVTTWGASITFFTKICDQGFDVSIILKTLDDDFYLSTQLVELLNKITKDLNKKLVQ